MSDVSFTPLHFCLQKIPIYINVVMIDDDVNQTFEVCDKEIMNNNKIIKVLLEAFTGTIK